MNKLLDNKIIKSVSVVIFSGIKLITTIRRGEYLDKYILPTQKVYTSYLQSYMNETPAIYLWM